MTKNNIVTMANEKFGTVRKIVEGDSVLYCGSDVAKALWYARPYDAISAHCRCTVKRSIPHPQSLTKTLEVIFIPEADVYRLICHSKLPSAMEFEKWVFEDVVPEVVHKNLNSEPEQLTLETSEYHYFPKTLNGEPVITVADFAYFTNISTGSVSKALQRHCILGEDHELLTLRSLAAFKAENPGVKGFRHLFVIKRKGVEKLLSFYGCSAEIPMIEEKKEKPAVSLPKMSVDECTIALGVLGVVRENLKKAENKEAEEAVNTAIQYTSWELSKRMIGRCSDF